MSSSSGKSGWQTREDMARLLSVGAGKRVTVEMLDEAIQAGLPTNDVGLLNIYQVCAWLNWEMANGAQSGAHDGN